MDRMRRGVVACSIVGLEPVRLIAKGDGRLDGAEALRFSVGCAGPGADPQPGDVSRVETSGGSGGLLLELEADLCLPPR
jgi:hypothetical protein